MTYDGLKKMEQELENLKTVRRKEVAEKIKEARGQGDLSENAEYDAAKEEQGEIESRIVQLENLLRNAEVIDEDVLKMDVVNLGSKVTVLDVEFDEEMEYTIVGSTEADPMNGRISTSRNNFYFCIREHGNGGKQSGRTEQPACTGNDTAGTERTD